MDFFQFQYLLYGLWVPAYYLCTSYPCKHTVECYVSRPMEKTIFLFFMLGVGGICMLINIIEIIFLVWKKINWEFKGKRAESSSSSSYILGTYPISDVTKVHNNQFVEPRQLERVIVRKPDPAPPGYYIPDVDPPSEKFRSPANGFPHIRLRAASFTTSESDVTTDDATSIDSMRYALEDNARRFL